MRRHVKQWVGLGALCALGVVMSACSDDANASGGEGPGEPDHSSSGRTGYVLPEELVDCSAAAAEAAPRPLTSCTAFQDHIKLGAAVDPATGKIDPALEGAEIDPANWHFKEDFNHFRELNGSVSPYKERHGSLDLFAELTELTEPKQRFAELMPLRTELAHRGLLEQLAGELTAYKAVSLPEWADEDSKFSYSNTAYLLWIGQVTMQFPAHASCHVQNLRTLFYESATAQLPFSLVTTPQFAAYVERMREQGEPLPVFSEQVLRSGAACEANDSAFLGACSADDLAACESIGERMQLRMDAVFSGRAALTAEAMAYGPLPSPWTSGPPRTSTIGVAP